LSPGSGHNFPAFNYVIVRAALKAGSLGGNLTVQVGSDVVASVPVDSHFMWVGPERSWSGGNSYHCGPAPGSKEVPNFNTCFQGFDEIVVPLGKDFSFAKEEQVRLSWTAKDGTESVAIDMVDFLFDEPQQQPADVVVIRPSDVDWIKKVEAGGKFYLKSGEYTLNKHLVVKEGSTIQGESMMGTKIKLQLPPGGKVGYGCMQSSGSRSGFLLQSNTKISFLGVYGFDQFAWHDNGNLCGGGAFETPGCADPALVNSLGEISSPCPGNIQTPGTTAGRAISNIHIEDVFTTHTINGVWTPRQGNAPIGSDVHVERLLVRKSWRDGVNFHGHTSSSLTYSDIRDTGDDNIAIWSLKDVADSMVFDNNHLTLANVAHNIAWYGGQKGTITNNYCSDALGGGARIENGFAGNFNSSSSVTWANNGPFARLNHCSGEHCPICDQYGSPQTASALLVGAPQAFIDTMTAVCTGSPAPSPPSPTPPAPTPPGPSPSPPSGGWKPCSSSSKICCDPTSVPGQFCPGNVACQSCGGGAACECPAADVVV
jgi:hypothetical protein